MVIIEEDLKDIEKEESDKDETLSEEEEKKEAYGEFSKKKEIDEESDTKSTEEVEENVEEELSKEKVTSDSTTDEEMDIKKASKVVKNKLAEALDKPANATISIEHRGENWVAMVEILEEEYLSGQNVRSMNDIIAVYEVSLSNTGELMKWERKSAYKRGEIKK
jgi:hypothetical protein